MYVIFCRITESHFGEPMNPHLMRACLATDIAINDPEHVMTASVLLGHHRLSTTERYYNMAQQHDAAGRWQRTILERRRAARRQSRGRR